MYCLVDEKHVIHNAAKGIPRNVVIDGDRMSVKNIELYMRVLEAEKKEDAVIEGIFKRINNQGFDISTNEQTKTLMTCTDNKGWILDDNVHTLAFGHYRLKYGKQSFTLGSRADNGRNRGERVFANFSSFAYYLLGFTIMLSLILAKLYLMGLRKCLLRGLSYGKNEVIF